MTEPQRPTPAQQASAAMNVAYVSRQVAHSSPAITLRIYAHLFDASSQAKRASRALVGQSGKKYSGAATIADPGVRAMKCYFFAAPSALIRPAPKKLLLPMPPAQIWTGASKNTTPGSRTPGHAIF